MAGARSRSRGHPFLRGRPKGVWYPDAVGVVPGYPKTEGVWLQRQALMREKIVEYNAAGITGRKGVPDGWAGRKAEAAAARELAHEQGNKAVDRMIEENLIVEVPKGDEERAEAMLRFAAGVALDPTQQMRERLQAAKLVTEYTRPKPASKTEVTVNKAEDFLLSLLPQE